MKKEFQKIYEGIEVCANHLTVELYGRAFEVERTAPQVAEQLLRTRSALNGELVKLRNILKIKTTQKMAEKNQKALIKARKNPLKK